MFKNIFLLLAILALSGCCDEDFIIPSDGAVNDMRANAIDVTNLLDANCNTANPIYSTMGSTADGGIGTCWAQNTNAGDVWFKVTGQPPYGYLSILIYTGGDQGTQQNTRLVLWDSDGTTELDCDAYVSADDDLYRFNGIEIGEEYYFSVSVPDEASKGTFSMCVNTSD